MQTLRAFIRNVSTSQNSCPRTAFSSAVVVEGGWFGQLSEVGLELVVPPAQLLSALPVGSGRGLDRQLRVAMASDRKVTTNACWGDRTFRLRIYTFWIRSSILKKPFSWSFASFGFAECRSHVACTFYSFCWSSAGNRGSAAGGAPLNYKYNVYVTFCVHRKLRGGHACKRAAIIYRVRAEEVLYDWIYWIYVCS